MKTFDMKPKSEREALKSFIVKTYFSEHNLQMRESLKLFLTKKENKFFKMIGLPKFLHTNYFLIATDGSTKLSAKVPNKEKPALKHLLQVAYKD